MLSALPQAIAQTSEWEKIYIKNVGYIDIPPTMEVQSGKYRVIIDETKKIYGYDASQLTIQQKGLNEFKQEGFQKYVRIIIETTFGSPGDYDKLDNDGSSYSASDVAEMNTTFKQATIQGFAGTGLKLVEWFPTELKKLNGYNSMHLKYKRQLNDKPIVMANKYIFMNYDRYHTVTLEYRVSEESYWKSDLEKALNSFRITNKR